MVYRKIPNFNPMKFEVYYPVHPELKKHILYYYFVKTTNRDHKSRYYSFPNITVPVNIHKNVACNIEGHAVAMNGEQSTGYITIANGMRESPLLVTWNGVIDKVTIAFQPVGLNHFIRRPADKAIEGYANHFSDWNSPAYDECLNKFYATESIPQRVTVLEEFLLSVYRPFEKAELLYRIVGLLCDFNQEMSIPQIAGKINTPERTLNRLFKTHTGISLTAYRKIARFRQSLENKVVKEKFKRLTDIVYESNYYDQSYFIKIYNQLSGKSPGDLYKSVEKFADDNLIFEFLENTIDFG